MLSCGFRFANNEAMPELLVTGEKLDSAVARASTSHDVRRFALKLGTRWNHVGLSAPLVQHHDLLHLALPTPTKHGGTAKAHVETSRQKQSGLPSQRPLGRAAGSFLLWPFAFAWPHLCTLGVSMAWASANTRIDGFHEFDDNWPPRQVANNDLFRIHEQLGLSVAFS